MIKQIISGDEAVELMREGVDNIAAYYEKPYRDDIRQACWLTILESINDGVTEEGQLWLRAKYAASGEYKRLTGHGFRPMRSKFKPPERVFTSWVGNVATKDADEEWQEPLYDFDLDSTEDFFTELKNVCKTDLERHCVETAKKMVEAHSQDKSINMTTLWIATRVGRSYGAVKAALTRVLNRYLERQRD